jgi:hypothetical protein
MKANLASLSSSVCSGDYSQLNSIISPLECPKLWKKQVEKTDAASLKPGICKRKRTTRQQQHNLSKLEKQRKARRKLSSGKSS